ncbi:MAG: DUF975 family protein [Coriobacteriia bacterium]|nr:DUF975 family protein [Coriobacteriia bacterium]
MLFIIPGIVAALSYSQAKYLMLKDPAVTPWDAIDESVELMRDYRMDYFILNLSFIFWWMLVIISFGLASLYVRPYVELTMAAFHRELVGDDEGAEVDVDEGMMLSSVQGAHQGKSSKVKSDEFVKEGTWGAFNLEDDR